MLLDGLNNYDGVVNFQLVEIHGQCPHDGGSTI